MVFGSFLTIYWKTNIMLLLQVLTSTNQASQMAYLDITRDIFLYTLIGLLLLAVVAIFFMIKTITRKSVEEKLLRNEHTTELNNIRKEHCDALEKIRLEMLKREEEKSRQWIESEKETLHVLGGVSTLLDLSDKFGRIESEKIIRMLEEIQQHIIIK
jgi:large-conductance mechanosensitive channel